MIQRLLAKGFRMVCSYGIYARTVRQQVQALVAGVLKQMAERLERVRIWDARRGVIFERALPPQVAGSARAGDLRKELRGVVQLLFGFVERLVWKRGIYRGEFLVDKVRVGLVACLDLR